MASSGWRVLFWLAVVAGVVVALLPAGGQDDWFAHADKLRHAASFAVLVLLGRRAGYRSPLRLAAGLLLLGIGIEVAQMFTPTRSADVLDVVADAAGIAVALAWLRFAPGRMARRQ